MFMINESHHSIVCSSFESYLRSGEGVNAGGAGIASLMQATVGYLGLNGICT